MVRFAEAARAARAAHRFRRRAHPRRSTAPPERHRRPRGRPPGRAGPRPRRVRPAQPGHRRGPAGRGREGRPRLRPRRLWPSATGATGWCSPGAARGRSPAALDRRRPGGGRAGSSTAWSRGSGATTWPSSSCDHGDPLDSARNDALARLAVAPGAGAGGHHQRPLRHARPATGWPPPWRRCGPGGPWTRWTAGCRPAPAATCARGPSRPAASPGSPAWWSGPAELGPGLRLRPAPGRPGAARPSPSPTGHDEMRYLVELVEEGATRALRAPGGRAGAGGVGARSTTSSRHRGAWASPATSSSCGTSSSSAGARHLLPGPGLGGQLGGLLRARGHQRRRGVASACLFERFLSPARDGPARHRRGHRVAAGARRSSSTSTSATAGATPPRWPTSSPTGPARRIRDAGKALGHAAGTIDALVEAGSTAHRATRRLGRRDRQTGAAPGPTIPAPVLALAPRCSSGFPRHLGIHSGGMVICDRPVVEVCPVEWATHAGPHGAAVGQGRLRGHRAGEVRPPGPRACSRRCTGRSTSWPSTRGRRSTSAVLPQEPEVYEMLCRADTVGVFQVESRAQMAHPAPAPAALLLRPRRSRSPSSGPGPSRAARSTPTSAAASRGAVTYLHPLLEPSWRQTLGVPLFQEQLMQMAIDVAGFTRGRGRPSSARPWASKRSAERMEACASRFYAGMAERGITGEAGRRDLRQDGRLRQLRVPRVPLGLLRLPRLLLGAWLKLHYPAAFFAALLNSQPMGFWSPQSLVADARRHGVEVRRPHVDRSLATASLEGPGGADDRPALRLGLPRRPRPGRGGGGTGRGRTALAGPGGSGTSGRA